MENQPVESKPFRSSFFSQAYKQPTIVRNSSKWSDNRNLASQTNHRSQKADSLQVNQQTAPPKECVERKDSSDSAVRVGDSWISRSRSQQHKPSSADEENFNQNQRPAVKSTESSGPTNTKLDPRENDPRLFTVLDPDQFVKDLKELDPQKKDPLPCNIMWAWSEVDKKGNGKVLKMDMHWLRKKFNDFVLENVSIESLIRLSDKEKDRVLTPKAMRRLISVACGTTASSRDLDAVMLRLAAVAAACAHGGFDETMTSDPIILSRALFEWWWIDCGHRVRLFRHVAAELPTPGPPALLTPRNWQPRPGAIVSAAASADLAATAGARYGSVVDLSMDSVPCAGGAGQADSDGVFMFSTSATGRPGGVGSGRKPPEWVTRKVTWTS